MRVDCPRCGRVNEVERLERGANEFCFNCDYPLFWASLDRVGSKEAFAGAGMPDPSLRRLPGVGGDVDEEGEACRRCGELNRLEAKFCDRCGLEFNPAPVPPPPPEPEPEVEEPVLRAPPPEEDYFVPIAAAVAAGVALVLLLGILVGLGALAVEAAAVIAVIAGYGLYRIYRRRRRGSRSVASTPQGTTESAQDGAA